MSISFPSNEGFNKNYYFWCMESAIHHTYFFVLFVKRQFSNNTVLWTLNLEKECEFISDLYRTNNTMTKNCAESSIMLFTGIWFNEESPKIEQLNYIGELVKHFQNTEGVFHLWIIVSSILIMRTLSKDTTKLITTNKKSYKEYINSRCRVISGKTNEEAMKTKVKDQFGCLVLYKSSDLQYDLSNNYLQYESNVVPLWLKLSFFLSMFSETWLMCVPYLVLFIWSTYSLYLNHPVINSIKLIESIPNHFTKGVIIGSAQMAFLWVSIIVLILDGIALQYSYHALNIKKKTYGLIWIIPSIVFIWLLNDFNIGNESRGVYSEYVISLLY